MMKMAHNTWLIQTKARHEVKGGGSRRSDYSLVCSVGKPVFVTIQFATFDHLASNLVECSLNQQYAPLVHKNSLTVNRLNKYFAIGALVP
jgi:endo-alpha-1,4-polygalactosaminidase (GH114 family)